MHQSNVRLTSGSISSLGKETGLLYCSELAREGFIYPALEPSATGLYPGEVCGQLGTSGVESRDLSNR